MKLKNYFLLSLFFIVSFTCSFSQNLKPFTKRFDQNVKGDMLIIGNNILNRRDATNSPNVAYNQVGLNSDLDMQYINVDGAIICSSRAVLDVPDPSGTNCFKIVYAGLYWGAILNSGNRANINQVKLKLPTGGYNNIVGQLIYDANLTPIGGDNSKPYACYADVTALVTGLANPEGVYTVADVISSTGTNGGTGLSAGWSLFIIYEDPSLTSKSIVSFDGFSAIAGASTLDIPISGFRTIPVGPVRAKYAFTALEGDVGITGDYLRINGVIMSDAQRPGTNFFNSKITSSTGVFLARTPNSINTLGYDAGIVNVVNPSNSAIANNATSATIRLGTTQDAYYFFFNAFAVDIIEPKILISQIVTSISGTPIGGADVNLCQGLIYEITFQNVGNDNVTSLTIKDRIPNNLIFDPATDLILPLGVSLVSYDVVTRELLLSVNNSLVEVGDPAYKIGIKAKVVCACADLDESCSNVIKNQAFSTYSGLINTAIFTDESFAGIDGCSLVGSSTNILINNNCKSTTELLSCDGNLTLTAPNGYATYTWSSPSGSSFTPVDGSNNQSVMVNDFGTYVVTDVVYPADCKNVSQTFNVKNYTLQVTNPILTYSQNFTKCPNTGILLPHIYLCGANNTQNLAAYTVGVSTYTWQKLNANGVCVSSSDSLCPNEAADNCWVDVANGSNYIASAAGEYRLILLFEGGCQKIFYFNVYTSIIDPTVTLTNGTITATQTQATYQWLDCNNGNSNISGAIEQSYTPINAGSYAVKITSFGCQVTSNCVVVSSLGTQNFENIGITVFPNPVNDQLYIKGDIIIEKLSLYNVLGQKVASFIGNNKEYTVKNIPSGNYILEIQTPKGTAFSRMIKE
jgi:uncharacterized repeat protein (TIGR01451 family)